jgi:transposase-like protein
VKGLPIEGGGRRKMYRRISEEKRKTAKAMLKAGKMVFEVAKALDLSRATVYRIRHEDSDEDVEALVVEIRKEMAGRYLLLADTILRGIDDTELDRASLKDKAIAAAIFTDKAAQLEKLRDGKERGPCSSENGLCPLETGLRQEGEGQSARKETENRLL